MQNASNTNMGAIRGAVGAKRVLRAEELLSAADKLISRQWDIAGELPKRGETSFPYPALETLRSLYQKTETLTDAGEKRFRDIKRRLSDTLGDLSEEGLLDAVNAAQSLFNAFQYNQIPDYQDLRLKYERAKPGEMARRILDALSKLDGASGKGAVQKLAAYSGPEAAELYDFLQDMEEIEKIADRERKAAEKGIEDFTDDRQLQALSAGAREALSELHDRLKSMGVRK